MGGNSNSKTHLVRGALVCVSSDLPAGRKCLDFLSYTANLGCSKCFCTFGTGVFGANNYGGFERKNWLVRSKSQHKTDIETIKNCTTKTRRKKKESELGCRYTSLLELPYFDPIWVHVIDPMHNLYLGTAKSIFLNIWVSQGILDI